MAKKNQKYQDNKNRFEIGASNNVNHFEESVAFIEKKIAEGDDSEETKESLRIAKINLEKSLAFKYDRD